MAENDDRDAAGQCLRLALPLMSRHAIPVTPENYAVWYAYVGATHPELVAALGARIEAGEPVDEAFVEELYRRFLSPVEEDQMAAAHEALRALVSDVQESVRSADGEASRYEASLAGYAEALDETPDDESLRALVDRIAEDTRQMRETGSRLHQRLEESRREVETLRAELDRTREEAVTDPLTGLSNRKAFDQALGEMTTAWSESPPCMLMVDIDHFKRVNDTFGHLLGDKVIQFIAKSIRSRVKGRDVVARFGGEEFAVLLPETPFRGAMAVAESLRTGIESDHLVRSETKEPIGPVTISIGVARFRAGENPQALVGRADEALYEAKNAGRNRVAAEAAPTGTGTDGSALAPRRTCLVVRG